MVKQIKWWKVLRFMVLPLMLLLAGCTVSLQDDIPPEMPASVVEAGTEDSARPADAVTPPAPGDEGSDELLPDAELQPPDEATSDGTDETAASGPTDGTSDSADSSSAPQEDVIHTVVRGETLGTIAQQYGVTVDEIAAANNIANVNVISVGDELVIPLSTTGTEEGEGDSEETDSADATPTATPDPNQDTIYIVKPGDNLYRIALNYGITVDELAAYNGIANVNRIEVGQEIRIPNQ
ncbi:MAG: LysM peptidoglycan-binding domain-containing protein [Anaerolineae bacterium]|nr:LysM peptidoglycan-binding domain-containing protein [Anaerolineae bacterium]MCO5196156.1 LysM peptidoglycan-binding domain-containing protein [Anaerolineae bacterium]